jgi:ubiquinone/menaquinone biosynthesis C-methylase UbiE
LIDPKQRFSDRVDDYVRYRPSYPRQVLELVERRAGLGPGSAVADIGSGTGILTRLLLESGARVMAVEPNAAMRVAAERALSNRGRFQSIDGSAEATGLADQSVDLVAAAQAFHWFEPAAARAEFLRVLKPGGQVLLVWNLRKETPFHRDYDDLLARFAPGYAQVRMRERASEPNVRAFFSPDVPEVECFDHEQALDEAALRGRLLSSSYAPLVGSAQYEPMIARLGEIFRTHEKGGTVPFSYETRVYLGRLTPR